MTLNIPTRRRDDDGNWVIEKPSVDPAAQRQFLIDHLQNITTATYPDGRNVYRPEVVADARQRLKELWVMQEGS